MEPLDTHGGQWLLADPQLAVDFVGTQRPLGDAIANELPPDHGASVWVREHVGIQEEPDQKTDLINLRAQLRTLFTAIVDSADLPANALDAINRLAAQAPVTLAGQLNNGGILVKRTSTATESTLLAADLARSALSLLTEPARSRLRICRAPGCALFFLTDHRRQQWCTPSCGNRARVARHYARRQAD